MNALRTHRLASSVIALSTVLAAPAFADVSAADIWANQQALHSGMGITLDGELNGDTVSGITATAVLPMGIANVQVSTDAELTMSDNGDGTVTVTFPSPMTVTVSGQAQGEDPFSAELITTFDSYTVIASGDPNDVSYTSQASNLRMEPGEITIGGQSLSVEGFDMNGFLNFSGWTSNSRVTVGNLITYTAETSYETTNADFGFDMDGVQVKNTQSTEPMDTSVTATLQVGGSDVLNLSAAMRDGLSLMAQSSSGGSQSSNETMMNGEVMNSQSTNVGPQTATVAFGEGGLVFSGDAEGFNMSMNEPMLFPMGLTFAAEALSMNFAIPLNASDDAQGFRAATSLQGFTMSDDIWSLFDPTAVLPRDPAEISFDITGVGTNGIDLLDIAALSQLAGPPPIEVDQVSIDNLRISAAGADVSALGAMTFDWTDFQTIPGVPRPEGEVTLNINGANALMDNLVAMGLLPEDQLMMPRMMMGMFATPVGDDMLQSVIEVNSQGHILANGQRLQ